MSPAKGRKQGSSMMTLEYVTVRLPDATPLQLAYTLFPAKGTQKGVVVAVHGITRQKRDFDFVAQALAEKGWRVLCFDAPGRGDSDWLRDPENYCLPYYASVFVDALEALGLSKVHWLGTSMGGLIALSMAAAEHADVFSSVTLIDITHRPNAAACARVAEYVTENLPVMASVEAYEGILRATLPLGDVPVSVWAHYARHQLVKRDDGYHFHFDPRLARRAQRELRTPIDISDGLAALQDVPLALVAGARSDFCGAAEIMDLQAAHPALALHIVPDAGHVPALSDTESQNFISDFLNRCRV